jgi:hypothetical protein
MRYTKRFAGWALAVGTMLMSAGAINAADWKDANHDRTPVEAVIRTSRAPVPVSSFEVADHRDSKVLVRKVHYDWRNARHDRRDVRSNWR